MSIIKKLHTSVKYPTSIIVKGANVLGVEIARSLLEQGGFVIIIDSESNASRKLLDPLVSYKNLVVLDFSSISSLPQDLRRLDYIFYFEHKSTDLVEKISTQKFLQNSNYLDSMLDLAAKFDAKFLLTTAIRAHQLNISNAQLEYNYGLNNKSSHTEYIELEIQRYAESLVHEYKEKVGINSRVLRLGEIIGRGTEFDQSSTLVKLIRDGLEGKDLVVPGDGLEANYYIHYLDAAYGILKAQFSASSKGKIFTLANPEEITVLSIAYKLLELLPSAREIKFDSSDDQYPPLILYKPAESLQTIGWKPRIGFDRALVQTIEYVQELLIIEKALKKDAAVDLDDKKNMSEKIRDFFFVAENESKETDAVAKLIAERKKLEMTRTGNMVRANTKMKHQQGSRKNMNFVERIDMFLHDLLFGFSRRVSFLKNVTITDFIVTVLLLSGFVAIYFMLISPLFSLSRNIFTVRTYFDRIETSVSGYDFQEAQELNQRLNSNLNSAQERVEDLQYLFVLTGRDQLYIDTQRFLESMIEYSQGYNDIFMAYAPFQSYINNFEPNLTYRFGESKLLTADDNGEHRAELDALYMQRGKVDDSLSRIAKANQESEIFAQKLPKRFVGNLLEQKSRLDENFDQFIFIADNYHFWPSLLGREKPVRYLVVVQDNTRFSMSGGAVVGYIAFTLDKGVLRNVETEVIGTPQFNKSVVTADVLSAINLVSSKDVNQDNIEFYDLAAISDTDLFLETIKNNYQLVKETKIDMVVTTNTTTLSRYLQTGGEINFQQINFNEDNLLNSVALLSDNDNNKARNEVLMNLYAKNITEKFNNLDTRLMELAEVFGLAGENKEMLFYSNNPELENFIRSLSTNTAAPVAEIRYGMIAEANPENRISRYPIATLEGEIKINPDYTSEKSLRLRLNSADNLQNAALCVSGGVRNAQNFDIAPELVSTTFSADNLCNIFLKNENLSYGLKYETIAFANSETKQTVYVLRLVKTPGIESNYDLEFTFGGGLNVVPEDQNFVQVDNKYVYSGILQNDKLFKFDISK